MESGSVSDSEVMVKFSESWIDPGINRLKLAKDSLGCWVVHKQDDDLTVLSLWDTTQKEIVLNKKLSIINQAISLNNAVNDSNDEFEDARERESQESGLLERKWLPEEELDVKDRFLEFSLMIHNSTKEWNITPYLQMVNSQHPTHGGVCCVER